MNRYQPADQLQDGVQTYRIVDTHHDTILPEVWYFEPNRSSAMDYLNRIGTPMTAEQATAWRTLSYGRDS